MADLYNAFVNIKGQDRDADSYLVEDLFPNQPHKLGCSEEGYPIIFVVCSDEIPSTPIRLKTISVDFSQLCSIKDNNGQSEIKKYSIIKLTSLESDLQNYFIKVFAIVLKKFISLPKVTDLKNEISKVAKIFMTPPSFSDVVVQGLWAELFVIANASEPEVLINAWHMLPDDKYDFNDGTDKIEVKSTSKMDRVHTFSIEQLNPNTGSELIIASVIVIRSGQGINIFDIIDAISERVHDMGLLSKIQEITFLTIGPNIERATELKYDFTLAGNTYMQYNYRDVPSISISDVPTQVSSVRFNSCLKDVPNFDCNSSNSELIKAL